MGERIALDYTNGIGDPIPCETWTDIDPQSVVDYARSRVPKDVKLSANPSLLELANSVDLSVSDSTLQELRELLGKSVLELES